MGQAGNGDDAGGNPSLPDADLVRAIRSRHSNASALHLNDVITALPLHRKRAGRINTAECNGTDALPVLIDEGGGIPGPAAEHQRTSNGGNE